MSCCVAALMLVYQLIEGLRRVRAVFDRGYKPRPDEAVTTFPARVVRHARKPWVQATLITVLVLEGAFAGALAYEHRYHLRNDVAALVFATGGLALDLCRSLTGSEAARYGTTTNEEVPHGNAWY